MTETAPVPFNAKRVAAHLRSADFKALFIEELGWDRPRAVHTVTVDGADYTLTAAAEKRGFQALVHQGAAGATGNGIPPYAVRKKIEKQVAALVFEHIIVYLSADKSEQVWQWVRREAGRPDASREVRYHKGQSGDGLIAKLRTVTFGIDDDPTVVDVAGRARQGFDVAQVTRRFYDEFKKQHDDFLKFLRGIPTAELQEWYTSVLLNRLMFIYFIQSKGFLDGDPKYLTHKLAQSKRRGKDGFYRDFLCPLFFEGFAREERTPAMRALLGNVPYLNGGLFAQHQIEQAHGKEIAVADAAFERIFAFFDAWEWVLDDRPTRTGSEINPDVLGYIFEKYINQKQMGAYYTKEDITEYICRNTIVPHLLDRARDDNLLAFDAGPDINAVLGRAHPHPERTVWRHLREDPDRYIFPAVKKGVELELPPEIAAGVADVSQRGGWNRPADEAYALPTEIWRETVARRQRYAEVRKTLAEGKVKSSNDLITINLDLRQFARDLIDQCGESQEDVQLLRSLWSSLSSISVLDPTCGSGAFLFAALNVLEDLYDAALDRMEWLAARAPQSGTLADFRETLAQVDKHPNRRYFILKRIIVDNLYGVDIMEEAVEIAKLRLFLKLVAQLEPGQDIEPLPDIDFNIRAGNTLVGFVGRDDVRRALETGSSGQGKMVFGEEDSALAGIDRRAGDVDRAFAQFRWAQTQYGTSARELEDSKRVLQGGLAALRNELDLLLARQYGVVVDKPKDKEEKDWEAKQAAVLARWRKGHEPFHWFIEFYGVMKQGGFDVIVGNPPYVSAAKVRDNYSVKSYATGRCPDIYAWVMERVSILVREFGRQGLIVPLSLTFSSQFDALRALVFRQYGTNWFSSFGRIPSALFSFDVRVRNTIHLSHKSSQSGRQLSTRLHRWFESERASLFQLLTYATFQPRLWKGRIAKLDSQPLVNAFETLASRGSSTVASMLRPTRSRNRLHFKKTAYNWLNFCRVLPPCYDERGRAIEHTKFGELYFSSEEDLCAFLCLSNGKLMLAYWFAVGDDFDVTRWMFEDFPLGSQRNFASAASRFAELSKELEVAMTGAIQFKLNAGKRVGNYNLARCRHVTDRSDSILAKLLGFDACWDALELHYLQTVRTDFGDDLEDE